MAAKLSGFEPVDGSPNLYTATKNNLRCTAVRLRTGGVCLYSPVSGLGDEAIESLAGIGTVRYLLAPNSYHNNGLVEYSKAFPTAHLVASKAAQERLADRTGLAFKGLSPLLKALPDGFTLVQPDGLKNGEVWLIGPHKSGYLWHVVDGFAGQKLAEGPTCKVARMPKVFPSFGISDREIYAKEVLRVLETYPPHTLLPCHGALVQTPKLAKQLRDLILSLG